MSIEGIGRSSVVTVGEVRRVLLRKRGRFWLAFIGFLTMVEFGPLPCGKQTWSDLACPIRLHRSSGLRIAERSSPPDASCSQPPSRQSSRRYVPMDDSFHNSPVTSGLVHHKLPPGPVAPSFVAHIAGHLDKLLPTACPIRLHRSSGLRIAQRSFPVTSSRQPSRALPNGSPAAYSMASPALLLLQ
jgi:hypothetical protein